MPIDDDRTHTISDDRLARLRDRRKRTAPARLALTLFHRDGVQVVPLAEGSPVVIGRFPPADLVLRDDSLSRQHARVEIVDGVAWVEDLGSTNGTLVSGERVERAPITIGSELALGAVSGVVHTLEPTSSDAESHDRFVGAVHREVARARVFGGQAAVLMLRPARPLSAARWIPRIAAAARPFDTIGVYSADTVELLRPEDGYDEARAFAATLAAADEPLLVGLAICPDHGTTAEQLVAAARASLMATTREGPVVAPPAPGAPIGLTDVDGPVFASPAMQRLERTARRLVDSAIPVLITGETGTGKEVVARLVGQTGSRSSQPMVTVNCGGIPQSLLESTIFGHVKGAFTGATEARAGLFEAADGGTLFLDEVGELPSAAQAALLRVLESGRFQRVGATAETTVSVRVIAATHRDLDAMARNGDFRRDLVYRLNAMTLEIPPLRERRVEIPQLVTRFLAQANADNGRQVTGVSDEALAALVAHDWPGNVRELKNAVERAVVIAYDDLVVPEDLPRRVAAGAAVPVPAESPLAAGDLREDLARFEVERIREVLDRVDWRREAAADQLGLPVRTLYRKMKRFGLLSD